MACLARDGHEVIGVNLDAHKLDLIRAGRSPTVAEGIQKLTSQVVAARQATVTDDVTAAVRDTELTFVCVGTPSSSNGSQDLRAVKRVMTTLGSALRTKDDFHSVVLPSTEQPGTAEAVVRPPLTAVGDKRADEHFGLCFQPEYFREGTSIRDYDNPPLIFVGTHPQRSADALRQLFGNLPCDFILTSIGVAELQKYACNAYHAVILTFANEVARLSTRWRGYLSRLASMDARSWRSSARTSV